MTMNCYTHSLSSIIKKVNSVGFLKQEKQAAITQLKLINISLNIS